jgi:hypothetical protein
VQPSEITDVLNRPISQELLARDLTRLAYVAKDGTPRRRSYTLLSVRTELGRSRYLLQAFSKHHVEGYFFVYSVFTDADWPGYYPLIRAMVANWVDLDGRSLGLPLPESLPG